MSESDYAIAWQPDANDTPVKSAASKKVASIATKKPKGTPTSHPPTREMVNAAIAGLKERGGSSLQAIKKYVAVNYKVDAKKMAPFIRKYLKSAVASGTLTQPKGKGASGSFKISVKGAKTTKGAQKPKAAAAKPRKPATAKIPKSAKSASKKEKKPSVRKVKTPMKTKKVSKPPTKKPKSPKPKKTAVKKQKAPKKSPAKNK